ncbi:LysR substrate-binding domain-containing protein [Hydrogenophaga sp. MI9]|uniref:LysR substrate-binding domain-containing protein n=1 Tax=Hydrogenophaga sp. MI9 TaxID=3453719 RepID=UPI003EECBFEB
MMQLKVRQLRVFEAVATSASFSRAAEQLEMTQPAVSMAVRQIEQALGTALFDPADRRRLSDAGQELLMHARIILAQVRAAEEAMAFYASDGSKETSRGLRGLLHLGVVQTANYFAPRLLSEFHQRHPDVHLKLTVAKRGEILDLLAERRLDIAITGYPPSEAAVEAHSFARHPHCIVAPVNHPLAQRSALEWTDLRQEDFIFREPGSSTRLFLEQLLQAQSIQVRQRLELSGNETVKHAVMEGLGVSFLSAHVFQVELEAGRIAVLDLADMPKYIDWCFIHRRDAALNGVNQAFKDFVFAEGTRIAACLVRG